MVQTAYQIRNQEDAFLLSLNYPRLAKGIDADASLHYLSQLFARAVDVMSSFTYSCFQFFKQRKLPKSGIRTHSHQSYFCAQPSVKPYPQAF
jgi:hypothetical protein